MRNSILGVLFSAALISGCATIGTGGLELPRARFAANYSTIRKIVVEEASTNGFSNPPSEVKPSQYNGYKGQLYFSLVTGQGTDQLWVEFSPDGDNVAISMHGAGAEANPESAIDAIQTRLKSL